MHVGVYTECLNQTYTGVETQAHVLVDGLSRTGNRVTCFHSDNPRHPPFQRVQHYLFRKPLPVPFYPIVSAAFRSSCFNMVDVLHIPYPKFPFFKKPQAPVVVTVHDIIPLLFPKYHNWKRIVYFRDFLPRLLAQ